IVRERRMGIGNRVEFLPERDDERTRGRRRIFRREGHADVGAFGGRRIGENALPTVATDEDRIESLALRFLQDLETRRHAAGDEHDLGLARLEVRYVGLRRRKVGVDWIE